VSSILLKATGIWFVILVAAVCNGIFREKILAPAFGPDLALPISGFLLAILVLIIAVSLVHKMGNAQHKTYLLIGLYWLVLTLFFEFIFGYFVADKSFREVIEIFNILKGNLFIVVLLVTAISPVIAAKVRGVW